ncbi:UDP-N-acetylglucosamine--N-acetylmuramyl-(pentapeptide) pyrophosphoryl-undecaprenol N-acetylglucosamine transferase [Leptospira perolatii]|uniref:UDP-N-acetylglucosamine--N-acetylmuramyl-(pentapeptide) pyrophosphoryl-undecaprenol N-acetylglucosamine transferase n=1 Tax=Leptospira perolatii TaxID=2023191 RepID=A0A2M9ZKK9_9LEPT|nr:UDP-N-acetylglucosamine--N-acetylmuramyl-(pentapeptide) pyrophosphoryl-undecaprenol N-acetylglucosamine transferase [Leptospira perolatii]PJZ69396.1 UDP-N-acetylglucosamine--N-acetylmuramyl-(pentapeptide) pyrophosphoryl-undecaprenol N-acetylglucosamine transferase [Leptospira perolatii]PJZ72531.1 UDP-N-acetylglucosamine--N-acetylmuramyl-(pentapeptide) pyrophosphoryl-undecaprenol N-acetylglucosamine transferase [Leptospira perolatii]
MRSIVIAAGGTGGHISPGVALAENLVAFKKEYGIEKVYIHSLKRNKDNPDLAQAPCEVIWHNTPSFSGNILLLPFRYIYQLIHTWIVFKKLQVDSVVGMGGYSSVPAILYAVLFRKKLFLCEQNCVPGKVNRIFFKFASKVAFSFPPKNTNIPTDWEVLGNPLREKIVPKLALKFGEKWDPKKKKQFNVLVMGGSQGARQINNMVVALLKHEMIQARFRFRMLTGAALYDEVSKKTKEADLFSYSENMAEHYEWANLVIARSGSGVVSECAAYALPMILIPYPFAKDDHQTANAKYMELNGAAVTLEQKDEDESRLFQILDGFAENPSSLNEMSVKSLECSHVEASQETGKYFFGKG